MLANLPCAECIKYHRDYDWQHHTGTGERQKRRAGTEIIDWERDGPPPCKERPNEPKPICPKISPEREHETVFSPHSYRAWQAFWSLKAGVPLTEAESNDRLLRLKLQVIERLWQRAQQHKHSEATFNAVLAAIVKTRR